PQRLGLREGRGYERCRNGGRQTGRAGDRARGLEEGAARPASVVFSRFPRRAPPLVAVIVYPAAHIPADGAVKSCEEGALRAFRSSCTRGGRGSTYSLTALWICAGCMTSVNLSPRLGSVNAVAKGRAMRRKQWNFRHLSAPEQPFQKGAAADIGAAARTARVVDAGGARGPQT